MDKIYRRIGAFTSRHVHRAGAPRYGCVAVDDPAIAASLLEHRQSGLLCTDDELLQKHTLVQAAVALDCGIDTSDPDVKAIADEYGATVRLHRARKAK